ncbi:hypothetical protein B0H14DRAFT_3169393 [Mycena olivaceomarginata]|nr:hypothetical protein B0H14DRAFT_3169393 [Mycena olivaceomarginata]
MYSQRTLDGAKGRSASCYFESLSKLNKTLLGLVCRGLDPGKTNELSTHIVNKSFTDKISNSAGLQSTYEHGPAPFLNPRHNALRGSAREFIPTEASSFYCKRLGRKWQMEDYSEGDADAEGEPDDAEANYISTMCPLASSSSPTQVVRGLVAPEMSAGEELRRSSRIQQLTRLKAPEKQVKSSLRNSKAPDDEAPSPKKKLGSNCLPSICVTNNVLLHQRKPAVTTSTPSHIGSVHPTTSMKRAPEVGLARYGDQHRP